MSNSSYFSFELNSFFYEPNEPYHGEEDVKRNVCTAALHNFVQLYLHLFLFMFRMECACAEKQRGRMLTRFLHDQAGRYPVEGVGDGLATASRHAAFSTFAYARFSDRTAGKLVPTLYCCLSHSDRAALLLLLVFCPSSSQWKGIGKKEEKKKNCFNSIDEWKIKFSVSINFLKDEEKWG